jgi:predicted PurR-regulated permease PerM
VGSVPVWVVGAIYLYMKGSIGKVVAMVVLGLFTGVIDNFVRPLVLKGRSEMHPLVALVAIFGGINWFGITGVFVGPILASILISLLEIWPTVARRSHLVAVAEPPKENVAHIKK